MSDEILAIAVYNRLSFSQILAKQMGYRLASKKENDKVEWIVIPNAHPAIISSQVFDRVNSMKGKHDRSHNQHYHRSEYLLTGIIKCSRCGFSFQGFHHKKTGNTYYVDGGYINKGRSVCSWFSVRKDVLEDFVLKSVKETLLAPGIIERVRDRVQQLLDSKPFQVQKRIQSINELLKENETKIGNLMRLAEEGTGLRSVASRLTELEEVQLKLKEEKSRLQRMRSDQGGEIDVVSEVVKYLQNFESTLATARMSIRKETLRRAVEKIVVDRDQRKVRCYIRTLPKMPILSGFRQASSSILGVSVALTGIEPVFPP